MEVRLTPPDSPLHEIFKSHRIFGLKAHQELKRAERYCEFISLVIVSVRKNGSFPNEFDEGVDSDKTLLDTIYEGLRGLISKSVRITDYVSGVEDDKLGLLLVETPEKGAVSLVNRIKPLIDGYTSHYANGDSGWSSSFSIISFPTETGNKEEFTQAIDFFLRNSRR